jgi:hypothetical protein
MESWSSKIFSKDLEAYGSNQSNNNNRSYTKMFVTLAKVLVCWGLSYYFMNVAANVASVRSMSNVENEIMKDLGFEFVPKVQLLWLTDFFDGIMVAIMGLLLLISPSKFEVLSKILMTSTLCNFLRVTTLVSTSCVDPRTSCEVVTGNIWTTVALHRCGDCMYSGHTILLALAAISWHFYCPQFLRIVSRIAVWGLALMGGFCIISNRSHYTSDVLIAFYMTIGCWFAVNYIWSRMLCTDECEGECKEEMCHSNNSRSRVAWTPLINESNSSNRSSSSEDRLLN